MRGCRQGLGEGIGGRGGYFGVGFAVAGREEGRGEEDTRTWMIMVGVADGLLLFVPQGGICKGKSCDTHSYSRSSCVVISP